MAGSMANVFKPRKWKWLARRSLLFLDAFTKEYGIKLSSLIPRPDDGDAFPVVLAVSVRGSFSAQISTGETEAAYILRKLADVIDMKIDQSPVTPSDQTGSGSSVVSVSYEPTEGA